MKNAASEHVSERKPLSAGQWRQVALITLGALALYVGFRLLPTGTNLSHTDFRTGGEGSLEMCDPSNPQFIPVVAMRSPVSMRVRKDEAAKPEKAGEEFRGVVLLATASGKPIGPPDLLVAHTRKLHLLIVDETLEDYQHVHPEPGERAGEWAFSFFPKRAGAYRVFADFVPSATGRGLYASADVAVEGSETVGAALRRDPGAAEVGAEGKNAGEALSADGRVSAGEAGDRGVKPLLPFGLGDGVTRGVYDFSLTVAGGPLRAGKQAELAFSIARGDGGDVALQPVMDAFAHLVAFDEARSGFAHLHPNEADLSRPPEARAPRLTFKITFPRGGRYVIWAQVNIAGAEMFVPFWVEIAP